MDELFRELSGAVSVPGNEAEVRAILARELSPHGAVETTRHGDLRFTRPGGAGKPRVAVCCHMDSPGFIVMEIRDDGTLRMIPLGGLDPEVCRLRRVRLRCAGRHLDGLLTLEPGQEPRRAEYDGFFGFESAEAARAAGVKKGDVAGFAEAPFAIGGLTVAPNVDNRIGCLLAVRTVERLASEELPCALSALATTCEETSLHRGAHLLAERERPDLALVFDVTYEIRDVRMGKGPVLTLSDASVYLSNELRDRVEGIASAAGLALQTEVYNYAGTDAAAFTRAGGGTLALPLLVATRHNHTPCEVFDPADVEATVGLACELVRSSARLLE